MANRNAAGSPDKAVAGSPESQVSRAGNGRPSSVSALAPLASERVVDPGIPLLHRLSRVGMLREIPKSAGRQWRAWCPICDGDRRNRHLLIALTGAEPRVECSNGCSAEDVLAGVSPDWISPDSPRPEPVMVDAPLPRPIADMGLPEPGRALM